MIIMIIRRLPLTILVHWQGFDESEELPLQREKEICHEVREDSDREGGTQ